ncbi:ABC transporter substrate-binding protein [Chromobacterium sp. IIBBL 290-4]|uniref:substrate-binding periplasmic protein n=1 Tax=Chromobacterium sp. IIBBL 290-4 TaxID=2953890 RepID=UPI0020B8057A|nr:transporter substrate-binding domain-containing protein [Chromobacterium sp. IIBBL 290-4]UTH72825.1 transporter substrate-binding domain-containing protein [Chromobacterium sp. IIBBL 290-4]
MARWWSITLAAAWLGLTPPAQADSLTIWISPRPPLSLVDDAGTVAGPITGLLGRIGASAGQTLQLKGCPVARCLMMARRLPDSCALSARGPARETQFKWSHVILNLRMVLLARAEDKRAVASLADVQALRVGVTRGTMQESLLKEAGVPAQESLDVETGLRQLQLERLDLFAALDLDVAQMAKRIAMPAPKVALVLADWPLYFACNANVSDEAMARLNAGVAARRAAGDFDGLRSR